MKQLILFVIFILILVFMLTGCGNSLGVYNVSHEEIEFAEQVCEPNDGLDYIEPELDYFWVHCNNRMMSRHNTVQVREHMRESDVQNR